MEWRNTNDLLWDEDTNKEHGIACDGGKTGWIPNILGQKIWGTLAIIVSRPRGLGAEQAAPAAGSAGGDGDRGGGGGGGAADGGGGVCGNDASNISNISISLKHRRNKLTESDLERYVVVVLGCKTRKHRFKDSRTLARWVYGIDKADPVGGGALDDADEGEEEGGDDEGDFSEAFAMEEDED